VPGQLLVQVRVLYVLSKGLGFKGFSGLGEVLGSDDG
jgi:hypothetical protein